MRPLFLQVLQFQLQAAASALPTVRLESHPTSDYLRTCKLNLQDSQLGEGPRSNDPHKERCWQGGPVLPWRGRPRADYNQTVLSGRDPKGSDCPDEGHCGLQQSSANSSGTNWTAERCARKSNSPRSHTLMMSTSRYYNPSSRSGCYSGARSLQ